MKSEIAVNNYEQACRRYLEIGAITDMNERARKREELHRDFEAAFDELLSIVDFSGTAAWHALGDAYSNGWGTTPDQKQAFEWFHRAAAAGHTKSMVRLGLMLQRPGPDGDAVQAILWFRRAADGGDASGMCFLGFAYREGEGVVCDFEEAVAWFIKAVEAGDSHSMIHAGRMYSGYLKRPVEALRWFLRAAEADQAESHVELAILYEDRKSPVYDAEKAVHWYLKVAEGSSCSINRARIALAHFCRNGEGMPADAARAKQWLHKVIESVPPTSRFNQEAKKLLATWKQDLL
jgi:TPR repeat protein